MIQRHRSELTRVAAATQKRRDAAFARQHHDAVRAPEERTVRRHRRAVEAEVNGHREVVHFGLRSARRCALRAVSASLRTEGEGEHQQRIRKRVFRAAGLPVRALRSARWSARALDVHAGTYVEVFLIFGVNRRSSWQLCHILLKQAGRARANQMSQPTQIDATDRPGARFQGSHRDGSSRPLALNARRASKHAPPVETLT